MLENGRWRMWYVSGVRWEMGGNQPRHYYHIRYAESANGLDWHREGIICIDFANEAEYAFSRPTVLKQDGLYRMWYSFRGDVYRLGYAESPDGIHWTRKDNDPAATFIDPSPDWEGNVAGCYPHVFPHDGKNYMLYNGADYGRTGIGLAVESN
jgi:hypothetical protein